MKACSKLTLVIGLAVGGGCVTGEPGSDETSDDETASAEQAIGLQTIYDVRGFGGNLFAENFNYATAASCSPGYQRLETPTTRWTSQGGGFCSFQGWLTLSNPFDCRALVLAHTPGGWFGGTCETFVVEEPVTNSYTFSTANTNSAQASTVNRQIALGAGQTLTIGTCDVASGTFSGDPYLRLTGPAGTPAGNDDACGGRGSRLVFTAPVAGTYEVRMGCYQAGACSGRVAWTIH